MISAITVATAAPAIAPAEQGHEKEGQRDLAEIDADLEREAEIRAARARSSNPRIA